MHYSRTLNVAASVSKLFITLDMFSLSSHFTKDCFGPDSTRSFFCRLTASTVEHYPITLREDLAQSPQSSRVRYRKSDQLLFLKQLKNSSWSKTVSHGRLGLGQVNNRADLNNWFIGEIWTSSGWLEKTWWKRIFKAKTVKSAGNLNFNQ